MNMDSEITTTEPDSNQYRESTKGSHRSRSRDRHKSNRNDRYDNRKRDHDRNYVKGSKGDNNKGRTGNRWSSVPSEGQFVGQPQMRGSFMGVPQFAAPGFSMGIMPDMNSMMHFPQMMQGMMGQQPMDGMMTNMNMNMNMSHPMMTNMIDQNMMMNMMNQSSVPSATHSITLSSCTLLPPIPGVQTPQRREKPNGCRTIFVGGMPTISLELLKEIFGRFGSICDIKSPRDGLYYVRFDREESVEFSFNLTGYRFKFLDQNDNEATTMYLDYAANQEDQDEYDSQHRTEMSPIPVEPFTPTALSSVSEKIKSDSDFVAGGVILASWLERGECTKQFANTFYSLIQSSNNQVRRLFNEKMHLDEELMNMKSSIKDKFSDVVKQFELVARILSAAKKQRVFDHFSKQQRRNIEMWLKMTEEVENIKEEFVANFDDQDIDLKLGKNMVPVEKYEHLKKENQSLSHELEEYKNKAHLATDEAERKFEKFKAHFIAQQALQNNQIFPPLPPSPATKKPQDIYPKPSVPISSSEAILISILTAFLLAHPLGVSIDYIVSYVRSMLPDTNQTTILSTLQKYKNIFNYTTKRYGASLEYRWTCVTFDTIKNNSR